MHVDKLNFGVVTVLGGAAVAIAFFVRAELSAHSTSAAAHPQIVAQLADIRADQIRTQIFEMDARLCDDPENVFYKQELIDLITKWQTLTKQTFPRELLRCT